MARVDDSLYSFEYWKVDNFEQQKKITPKYCIKIVLNIELGHYGQKIKEVKF